ncbi:deoxycytidyl transferase, partial [Chytriomyces hyalinus]
MAYDGFGEYMAIKLNKQQKQHTEYLQSGGSLNQGTQKSRVLDGVTMWFDGFLGHGEGDSLLDMKRLVVEHGGLVIDMLTLDVTHIIAMHLTDRKIELWKNRRIVDPAWIHESIKAGRLLPWQRYGLIQKSRASLFAPVLRQQHASTLGTVTSSTTRELETKVETDAATLDRIEQEAAQFKQSVLQSGKPQSPSKGRGSRSIETTRYGAPKLQEPNQPNRESSDFAIKNSATSAGFLTKYYESSRLSKISNWKSDLRDFVVQLQSDNPKPVPAKPGSTKTIMHIDMDCFFASVAIRERPELKNRPVVVCHSRGTGAEFNEAGPQDGASSTNSMSTSEIASCNYIARRHGVKNGMFLGKAQQLVSQYYQQQQQLAKSEGRNLDEECHSSVSCVPYDFEKYDQVSKALYKILYEVGDALMVVSCDEAYIDVSSKVLERGVGQELILAEKIREDVFLATGCTASVGIGENMVIARVATKKAKPNGAFMISSDQIEQEFSLLS